MNQLIKDFDRLHWLQKRNLLNRRCLFLDLSYWIGMCEGRTIRDLELKRLLSDMVENNELICPISPSLLMEFKKRPKSKKRDQYGQLMDQLSKGLSIRNWPVIFKEEFRRVAKEEHIEREIAYSHFIEAFSAGLHVTFDEAWSEDDADLAANLIFEYLDSISIVEVLDIEIDENQEGSISFLRDGLTRISEQEAYWRKQNPNFSTEMIEEAEFASVVRSVLPQIFRAFDPLEILSLPKLISTSIDEKRELIKQCPTFWCQFKLISTVRSHNLKITENDLWDRMHVATALPYVDCIACDGNTRHISSDMLKLDVKYDTTIVSKKKDLLAWLRT
jgi:hypothetical protein